MPNNLSERLPAEIVKDLQKHWIPQLRQIRKQRQGPCDLMRALLLGSVLLVAGLAVSGAACSDTLETVRFAVPKLDD